MEPSQEGFSFDIGCFVDVSQSSIRGLVNQGATCYLNSYIQTLYMTPEIRAAIYAWKYNVDGGVKPEYSIALQLQRLFAKLQISSMGACSTSELTKSFGWEIGRAVQQECRDRSRMPSSA
eukprot:TRINITY_DN59774_c0_g1_i2.p1 TRINITY_DN59774_c0_g1~~TRINITY_DN59774_c0_g1_i2.p1  ORF type:complete len:120 (+),score=13.55 TRINITY_DN59774_c0_g1_i2:86-445(+)